MIVEEELQKNNFNSSNSGVVLWKTTYDRNDPSVLTIIPVNQRKMSIEIKYAVANNSKDAKEPKQATTDSAGYDLFAIESKTLLPHDITPITFELLLKIPDGYFGTIYPRLGLLVKHFVSYDVGVIDSGYHGVVLVLMTNHSDEPLLIKGFGIAQLVFHKKEKVVFKQISATNTESRQQFWFNRSFIFLVI